MLQQTQAARVAPRWRAFLARFPTPAECAAAPRAALLAEWAGLGYNRRAVALQRAAAAIVERHGGAVPSDLPDLLALPGVGPYTARAVLAFAFERDVAVLDVNARRVLARVLGGPVTQAAADGLVPAGSGWRWNQALLDLGATVCRQRPRCASCPVRAGCRWSGSGADPYRRPRAQARFEGSDRQARGRLVAALLAGPVPETEVPAACGWPGDLERAERIAAALVHDGIAERAAGALRVAREGSVPTRPQ